MRFLLCAFSTGNRSPGYPPHESSSKSFLPTLSRCSGLCSRSRKVHTRLSPPSVSGVRTCLHTSSGWLISRTSELLILGGLTSDSVIYLRLLTHFASPTQPRPEEIDTRHNFALTIVPKYVNDRASLRVGERVQYRPIKPHIGPCVAIESELVLTLVGQEPVRLVRGLHRYAFASPLPSCWAIWMQLLALKHLSC